MKFKYCLSLTFFISLFVFFKLNLECYFSFQEQLQMFLLSSDYFLERIVLPGGLTDYISEFFVQFYNKISLGIVIMCLSLSLIQILTHKILSLKKYKQNFYPLSFLPSLFVFFFMGDESVLFSVHISLIVSLLAIYLYLRINNPTKKFLFYLLGIPIFYYLFGNFAYMLLCFCTINDVCRKNKNLYCIWGFFTLIFTMLIAYTIFQFPLMRIVYGINYIRYPFRYEILLPIFWIVCPIFLFVLPNIRVCVDKKIKFWIIESLALIVLFVASYNFGYSKVRYDAMQMDYLVRTSNYKKIIEFYPNSSKNEITNTCYQYAMCMMDKNKFMNGLPKPQLDKFWYMSFAEIALKGNDLTTAYIYFDEAMHNIPNFRLSARSVKRLAEISKLLGKKELAKKYAEILTNTLFYSKFAEDFLAKISD